MITIKKKSILIIFLFSIFFSIIIYKINYKSTKNILLLGDTNLKDLSEYNYIYYLNKEYIINDLFLNEYNNYQSIYTDIKNNKYVYLKGDRQYLNNKISLFSDYIIISAGNSNYISKCNKATSVIKNYNYKIFNELNNIINIIKKISDSKIIVIGNYCSNYNEEISNYLSELYKEYNYINMYEVYNKYKNDNLEYNLYLEINKMLR